ncbi:MAG: hypothetical protein ABSH25_08235 [Syntrophorhabdales bacterium]
MAVRRDMRFRVVGWLLYFSILFLFAPPLRAEELFTRTDELSCGNALVQAFTTCTEDSHDPKTAVCTDQHFVFINKRTGAAVKVDGSGKPVVQRDLAGGKIRIRYDALARDWACLESGTGSYVYIEYTRTPTRSDRYSGWEELLDLKGRRLASNMRNEEPEPDSSPALRKAWQKTSQKIWDRFSKVWNSKSLRAHPFPLDEFVPIQIFKTNRTELFWPIR